MSDVAVGVAAEVEAVEVEDVCQDIPWQLTVFKNVQECPVRRLQKKPSRWKVACAHCAWGTKGWSQPSKIFRHYTKIAGEVMGCPVADTSLAQLLGQGYWAKVLEVRARQDLAATRSDSTKGIPSTGTPRQEQAPEGADSTPGTGSQHQRDSTPDASQTDIIWLSKGAQEKQQLYSEVSKLWDMFFFENNISFRATESRSFKAAAQPEEEAYLRDLVDRACEAAVLFSLV